MPITSLSSTTLSSPRPWMSLPEFNAALSRSVMALDVVSDLGTEFRAHIEQASRDSAIIATISAMSHRATRTESLIRSADEQFVKVSLLLSGGAVLTQEGRSAILTPGDMVVYDSGRPYTLLFTESSRSLVVAIAQRDVGVPLDAIHRLTAIKLTGDEGPARLAVPFLTGLGHDLRQIEGPSGRRLVRAAASLISAMVISELESDAEAAGREQATFDSACDYIRLRLADPDLAPGMIADAMFMSVRKLYTVFRARGTTVAAWIREQRLLRCREALSHTLDDRPVSQIASQWGYRDAPGFSRAYRAMFGESPRETRLAARHA